mmetsp:Transcript_70530/g.222818  ORF Transcript_70530/g.222818 Transcript_70530/m.222818 type:complete len:219 (+) Transcript_70530:399-1055(+)
MTRVSPWSSSGNCMPRGSEVEPLSRMTVVSTVLLTLHSTFSWLLNSATIFSAQPVTPFTDTMASPCFNCNCGEALELKSVKGPSLNPITWSVASSRGSRSKPKEMSRVGLSTITVTSAGSAGGRGLPATFTFTLTKAWLTWASCSFSSPLKPFRYSLLCRVTLPTMSAPLRSLSKTVKVRGEPVAMSMTLHSVPQVGSQESGMHGVACSISPPVFSSQ